MALNKRKNKTPKEIKAAIDSPQEENQYRPISYSTYQYTYSINKYPLSRIVGIVSELKRGQFCQAAQLWSEMLNDSAIASVVNTRISSLLGADLVFEPGEEDKKAATKIKTFIEDNYCTVIPDDQLRALFTWYLGLKCAIGQLVWEIYPDGSWLPTLKTWSMEHVSYNPQTDIFTLRTDQGDIEVNRYDNSGKWLILCDWQPGILNCGVSSLAGRWLAYQYAMTDWGKFNEKHGMPILKATMPPNSPAPIAAQFQSQLNQLKGNSSIILRSGDGMVFDVNFLESNDKVFENFAKAKEVIENDYYIYFLGQNLTTNIQGGSYSAANVHRDVRIDISKADSKLINSNIREQVLIPIVLINFTPDESLTPYMEYQLDPPENLNEKATSLSGLADAITKITGVLANTTYDLDISAMLADWGVPLVDKAETPTNPAPDNSQPTE